MTFNTKPFSWRPQSHQDLQDHESAGRLKIDNSRDNGRFAPFFTETGSDEKIDYSADFSKN